MYFNKIIPELTVTNLENSLKFKLDRPYAIVTFHPVTLEGDTAEEQFKEILDALDEYPQMKYIFTKANADANGRVINKMIDKYVVQKENAVAFESLGVKRYLSSLKYATMVIGNSKPLLL